jgi:hypothetical protein
MREESAGRPLNSSLLSRLVGNDLAPLGDCGGSDMSYFPRKGLVNPLPVQNRDRTLVTNRSSDRSKHRKVQSCSVLLSARYR